MPTLASVWPRPDLADPALRLTLTSDYGIAAALAIAPDGTWLATTSDDRAVRIWDAATGRQRATLTGHTSRVTELAIAPDGTWLATTSEDRTVRIWNPGTGGVSAVMRVDISLSDCAWSPSGRLLAVAGDAGLYLFAFNS